MKDTNTAPATCSYCKEIVKRGEGVVSRGIRRTTYHLVCFAKKNGRRLTAKLCEGKTA